MKIGRIKKIIWNDEINDKSVVVGTIYYDGTGFELASEYQFDIGIDGNIEFRNSISLDALKCYQNLGLEVSLL